MITASAFGKLKRYVLRFDARQGGLSFTRALFHGSMKDLRNAVLWSGVSKASGFMLQVLAVPLAIRTLDAERYGVAVGLLGILGFLSVIEAAVGVSLLALAANVGAVASSSLDRLFSGLTWPLRHPVALCGASICVGVFILTRVIHIGPPASVPDVMWIALLGLAQFYGALCVRYRHAEGMTYINDRIQAAANLVAAVCLWRFVTHSTTVLEYVAMLAAPAALGSWINILFIVRNAPEMARPLQGWCQLRTILVASWPLLFGYLGIVLEREIPKLWGVSTAAKIPLAQYGCFLHFASIAASVILFVSIPVCSLLAKACRERNYSKAMRLIRSGIGYGVAVAVALGIVLIVTEGALLRRIYGNAFAGVDPYEASAFGIWLAVILSVFMTHQIVSVLGAAPTVSRKYIINGVLTALSGIEFGMRGQWVAHWLIAAITGAALLLTPQVKFLNKWVKQRSI